MALEQAVQQARLNPTTNLPRHAAVLTDGRFSFVGMNSRKTHPLQARFGRNRDAIHLHAEIDAIVKAVRAGHTDLSSFTMYVARVFKNGQPALSKPCKGCQDALMFFNVKHVEWT